MKRYVYDIKTSSNPKQYYYSKVKKDELVEINDHTLLYTGLENNAASESLQLGIYSQEVKNPNVGYVVIDKTIRKRTPRVRLTEIKGTITENHLDNIFNEIDETLHNIKEEKFEKKKDISDCFGFGKCEFYNLCHGGSFTGLEKKVERKKT